MALINGALQIGRTALTSTQTALTVTGNNIANAATPGYSRQRVKLAPTQGYEVLPGKYAGTGVAVYDIKRAADEALNERIWASVSDSNSFEVQQQAMARVEAAFNELTDQDMSSKLNAFFGAWSALQSNPQDMASRNIVTQTGANLTNFIQELREDLRQIQIDLDDSVKSLVEDADSLAQEVADLNVQIVTAESGNPGSAGALRDQRDAALKQLSEMIDINVREMEGGSVNVFVGNEPLVQYADARDLTYVEREDINGEWVSQVTFADNNEALAMNSGKIAGVLKARDDQVGTIINDLDNWVGSLVLEVNTLHSMGRGLDRFDSVTASFDVDETDASLADTANTNLPWAVTNGIFNVNVYSSDGTYVTHQVKVDIGVSGSDTTLEDLQAQLDAIDGLDATIDGNNALQISASNSGGSFAFSMPDNADDATNVLAVLGINTFFSGHKGYDIEVRSELQSNGRLLAAGETGLPGDGQIAGQIGDLSNSGVDSLAGVSLTDKFETITGTIATKTRELRDNYEAADVVVQTLENERQSISGVSVDEEAMDMIVFQRTFQGAARYVSLIDKMLDEVMSLV